MILPMTVNPGFAGMIRCKSYFRLCACLQQNYIFNYIFKNSSRRLAVQGFQFKTVPVEMHGMNIIAPVIRN